jgi:GT2 family glycosyltransferase
MGRAIIEAGYTVVYDVDSTVDHSHDYGPEKMRWRGNVDGKFNVEWMQRTCVAAEEDIELLGRRLAEEDLACLEELGTPQHELPDLRAEALVLREAMLRGLYEGGLSTRRYPHTEMRAHSKLRVLYVLDGARAEDLLLAEALGRRGHRVSALVIDAQAGGERIQVQREDRAGLVVLRVQTAIESGALEACFCTLLACEQPDLVHCMSADSRALQLLTVAHGRGLATVASLDDDPALCAQDAALPAAVGVADLRLCSHVDLRKAWIAAAELDPQLIAFAERGTTAGTGKTVHEEARELEFRYLALCCIVRADGAWRTHFEASGAAARTAGETLPQGPAWLLMRPNSSAEYLLPGLPEGPMCLELEQFQLGAEPSIALAGRALIDGVEIGRFDPGEPLQQDQVVRQRIECVMPRGARVLRLEPQLADGSAAHLRVCRVTLTPPRRFASASAAQAAPPAADLARLAQELRVAQGAPVAAADLPRLTIVVPNFNGASVLPDCLSSILALEYPAERVEVLLVDNGSSDESLELVRREFPTVRVVSKQHNLGFAAACNAGAREARQPGVLAFLNNDMRFERDFMLELVAPLARGDCAATTAKILGWDGRTIDTSGTGTTFLGIAVQPGFGQAPRPEHDVARKTLFACGGAMAIDAKLFREVGGFDEQYFAYYEDLDLGWRLWLMGHEVHYRPGALCYHHHSHTSKRFSPEVIRLVMIRNSLLTCIKNYDEANFARILPAMLALAIRRAHLKLGLDEHTFRIEAARLLAADESAADTRVKVERLGAADLIAINDVLSQWEHWMRRRREVQSRRRRGDDQIQRMFLEPLACVEGDAAYAALQAELIARFGLEQTFARD